MPSVSKVDVYPQRALFGAIDFNVTLRNDAWRRIIQDAQAEVLVNDQVIGRAYQASPDDAREAGRERDFYVRLRMLLDPASLQALEVLRNGKALDLNVRYILTGLNMDPGEATPRGDLVFRATLENRTRIEKSRWVEEFLPTFGLHGYQMWELRFPRMTAPGILASETESLERAIHDYHKGDYADAFRDCREMVEKLQARKQELELTDAVGTELWGRAETLFSVALHARTGNNINRADAEFAIALAQAIHRRVSHALDNPKRTAPEQPTVRLKA